MSPFLISLASLDSFPPGEAMGAVSASGTNGALINHTKAGG